MFFTIRTVRACFRTGNILNLSNRYAHNSAKPYLFSNERPNPQRSCAVTHIIQKRLSHTDLSVNGDPLLECNNFFPLSDLQVASLTSGDAALEKKLRELQMEFAVIKIESYRLMPDHLTTEMWRRILGMNRAQRWKYLGVLALKQRPKERTRQDDELFADINIYDKESTLFDYKLFRNAMFPMLHQTTMADASNRKLVQALEFGSKLVFDCDYEKVMAFRDINSTCQQIAYSLGCNRDAREPFNLMFCNLKKDSIFYQSLWKAIPTLDSMPVLHTEQCYTELFPKERLVYLTPHCREELVYDPKDVYIIGAMVDKVNPGPFSLIKAKSQGIRMASFPLDKYLIWKQGVKTLTVDQVVGILVKLKASGSWIKAFEAVPQRKVALRHSHPMEKIYRIPYHRYSR